MTVKCYSFSLRRFPEREGDQGTVVGPFVSCGEGVAKRGETVVRPGAKLRKEVGT